MAFNPDFDKKLRMWNFDPTGLAVSVDQYKDGVPKFQIGPRYRLLKNKSTSVYKVGRLSLAETKWLQSLMEEIVESLETL